MWRRFTPAGRNFRERRCLRAEGGLIRLLVLVFRAAGALLAQDGRGWLNQGVSEFKSGDYPQAVADFQKAVDSDPSNTTFRLYLATAWMQQYVPGVDTPDNRGRESSAFS